MALSYGNMKISVDKAGDKAPQNAILSFQEIIQDKIQSLLIATLSLLSVKTEIRIWGFWLFNAEFPYCCCNTKSSFLFFFLILQMLLREEYSYAWDTLHSRTLLTVLQEISTGVETFWVKLTFVSLAIHNSKKRKNT